MNPFTLIDISPSYSLGFGFEWEVDPAFDAAGPWVFHVQEGPTQEGPWEDLSPALESTYAWSEGVQRLAPKDPVLYFRIRLTAGGKEYYSHVVSPYGDLARREFLIVRDIIRQELLQQRQMTGTQSVIWRKAIFGPKCTNCTDFVTGEPTTSSCPYCYGTGHVPGYHGPYPLWVTFSTDNRRKHMTDNDGTEVKEPYSNVGRVVGTMRLKKDDIIVDTASDRRYFVDDIRNAAEVRRYPVVQLATLNQIASTHPVYKLR